MSIFKKIVGEVFDTTRERAEFTNELCEHLRQIGVNSIAVKLERARCSFLRTWLTETIT